MKILFFLIFFFPYQFGKCEIFNGIAIYKTSLNENINFPNDYKNQIFGEGSSYNTVIFNEKLSYNISSNQEFEIQKFLLNDLSAVISYHLNDDFYIQKDKMCSDAYDILLRSVDLKSSNVFLSIKNINCEKFFSVNTFGDTSFYFLTDKLPKTAGVSFLKGLNKCIIGFENKSISCFLNDLIIKSFIKEIDINRLRIDKKIFSNDTLWMDGAFEEIEIGKIFPKFISRDINNRCFTIDSIIGKTTIFLLLDKIKHCQFKDSKLKDYYEGYDEQNNDILSSLNLIANNKYRIIILTNDYKEFIDNSIFPNLIFIPNTSQWKRNHFLFDFPKLLFLNQEGIVYNIISIIDIPENDLKEGIQKLLQ